MFLHNALQHFQEFIFEPNQINICVLTVRHAVIVFYACSFLIVLSCTKRIFSFSDKRKNKYRLVWAFCSNSAVHDTARGLVLIWWQKISSHWAQILWSSNKMTNINDSLRAISQYVGVCVPFTSIGSPLTTHAQPPSGYECLSDLLAQLYFHRFALAFHLCGDKHRFAKITIPWRIQSNHTCRHRARMHTDTHSKLLVGRHMRDLLPSTALIMPMGMSAISSAWWQISFGSPLTIT